MSEDLSNLGNDLLFIGIERRFALDIASVIVNIRKYGLLHVDAAKAKRAERVLNNYHLNIIARRQLVFEKDNSSREGLLKDINSSNKEFEPDIVELWYSTSFVNNPKPEDLYDKTGEFLDYPSCCIKAMRNSNSLSNHYLKYLSDTEARFWEINRLTALFSNNLLMPDFFPCSLSCRKALEFSKKFIELSGKIFGDSLTNQWINEARQPFFIWRGYLYTSKIWTLSELDLIVDLRSTNRIALDDIAIFDAYDFANNNVILIPFTHFYSHTNKRLPNMIKFKNNNEIVAESKLI